MAATDDECVDAARDAADLLASLGHHVEDASPAALDDEALMVHFTTILTTSVVEDVRTAGRAVGRDLTAADVEPLTWQYYEAGLQNQAIQYLEALNALHVDARRRVMVDVGRRRRPRLRPAAHSHPRGAATAHR
jgi:amidase